MIYTKEQAATVCYIEPTEELRQKLSAEEFAVLVEAATEPPFQNAFWDNHRAGIYVDRIDGSPLFASSAKFDSGTGWPSFWAPIDPSNIVLVNDDRDAKELDGCSVVLHCTIDVDVIHFSLSLPDRAKEQQHQGCQETTAK